MTVHAGYNLVASEGTVPQFAQGDETETAGGARYRYCKANGAIAAYQLCHVSSAGVATPSTTTLVGTPARPTDYCIPQFAVADGEYFWGAIGPFTLREDNVTTFKVLAALNCAADVKLYTTGVAGVADDSATTAIVAGLALTETITTARAANCVATQRLVAFSEL